MTTIAHLYSFPIKKAKWNLSFTQVITSVLLIDCNGGEVSFQLCISCRYQETYQSIRPKPALLWRQTELKSLKYTFLQGEHYIKWITIACHPPSLMIETHSKNASWLERCKVGPPVSAWALITTCTSQSYLPLLLSRWGSSPGQRKEYIKIDKEKWILGSWIQITFQRWQVEVRNGNYKGHKQIICSSKKEEWPSFCLTLKRRG